MMYKTNTKWKQYITEAGLFSIFGNKPIPPISTVEDLLSTIKAIIAIKRGEKLAGKALSIVALACGGLDAAKELIGTEPGAVTAKLGQMMGVADAMLGVITGAKDIKTVLSKSAMLPDSQRSKAGYLSMLDFDDPYLEILDNELENDLLNFVLKKTEEAVSDGTNIEEFDINRIFEEFIAAAFKRKIAGAPKKDASSMKAMTKKDVAKARVKQKTPDTLQKVASAVQTGARHAVARENKDKSSVLNENWKKFIKEEHFDRSKLVIKEKLNPSFWNRGRLHEQVSSKLIEIAQDFYSSIQESLPFVPEFEDITFTGSLASYNYHNSSDIDLHLIVDFNHFKESEEILSEYFALKRIQWNRTHDIMIFGHEVEIYIQNSNEEHFANGVYSILRNEWNEMPVKEAVEIDFERTKKKYYSLVAEIKELSKLFKYKEYKKVHNHASKLKQKIRNMRKSGLEEEGTYSAENLAFKMLRINDHISNLMSLKVASYDKMMSLSGPGQVKLKISENWKNFINKGAEK